MRQGGRSNKHAQHTTARQNKTQVNQQTIRQMHSHEQDSPDMDEGPQDEAIKVRPVQALVERPTNVHSWPGQV
jgi:hypothetical protein